MSTATATKAEVVAPEVQVGDFFSCSWGYDQTNIDFYKVVGRTAKSVKVQQWSSASAGEGRGTQEAVVPGEGPRMFNDWSEVPEGADYWTKQEFIKQVPAPVQTKRLKDFGNGSVWFSVNSYSSAKLWGGKAEYQTAFGFGH